MTTTLNEYMHILLVESASELTARGRSLHARIHTKDQIAKMSKAQIQSHADEAHKLHADATRAGEHETARFAKDAHEALKKDLASRSK